MSARLLVWMDADRLWRVSLHRGMRHPTDALLQTVPQERGGFETLPDAHEWAMRYVWHQRVKPGFDGRRFDMRPPWATGPCATAVRDTLAGQSDEVVEGVADAVEGEAGAGAGHTPPVYRSNSAERASEVAREGLTTERRSAAHRAAALPIRLPDESGWPRCAGYARRLP
jgi:hypothetical protein